MRGMPLESLLELVETLRSRIDEHGDDLRLSEALTRYALIDPMLRELGWDTADPQQVVPEYRVPNNQMADYVLMANGSPSIVVESKKLDESLQGGKALDQGILYCAHTRSRYFLLTDGRRWELYEASSIVPAIRFDVKGQSPPEVCLKALALWRPSVGTGHVDAGSAPVVGSPPEVSTSVIPDPAPNVISEANISTPPVASQDVGNDGEWISLSDWKPVQNDPQPVEIMFPDRTPAPIRRGYDVAVKPTSWLIGKGLLTARNCPISNHADRRILLTDDPDQLTDKPADKKEVGGGLYIGTQYNGHLHVRNARKIIERVGQAPSEFKVRFS